MSKQSSNDNLHNNLIDAIKEERSSQALLIISQMKTEDFVKYHDMTIQLDHLKSPIYLAIQYGLTDVAKELLDKNPDYLKILDQSEGNLIDYAARYGNKVIVDKLLEMDPGIIDRRNSIGYTVLHSAAQGGNIDIVNKFLELRPKFIDAKAFDKGTVLHSAARGGNIDIVNRFLAIKPDLIKKTGGFDTTVLHTAVGSGKVDIAKRFLELQPDLIKASDVYGREVSDVLWHQNNTAMISMMNEHIEQAPRKAKNAALVKNSIKGDTKKDIEQAIENFQSNYTESDNQTKAQLRDRDTLDRHVGDLVSNIVKIAAEHNLITREQQQQYHTPSESNNIQSTFDIDVRKICNTFLDSQSSFKNKLYNAVVTVTISLGLKSLSIHYENKARESHRDHVMKTAKNIVANIANTTINSASKDINSHATAPAAEEITKPRTLTRFQQELSAVQSKRGNPNSLGVKPNKIPNQVKSR